MSLYRRGHVWWFKFDFQGATIRESSGLTNKEDAREKEAERHNDLRKGRASIRRPARARMFSSVADDWLQAKASDWAAKTAVIERSNLKHLKPFFGNNLLSDIGPEDVGLYRQHRLLRDKAAQKTVSLELGTLRAMMLFNDLDANWCAIKKKIKLKKARKIGRVISTDEEAVLLRECRASRSRSLYVAVMLALQTCMRHSEIRLLEWRQIDLSRRVITVGESKTDAGEGRVIPLTRVAYETLLLWAAIFPVTRPIGTWKEAWEAAKTRAGVECRFHDLRHTGCSRLLDAGVSHPVVAEILGWSTSTAIRMIKEVYGHINLPTRQRAMEQVEQFMAAQKAQNTLRVGTEVGTFEGAKVSTIQ